MKLIISALLILFCTAAFAGDDVAPPPAFNGDYQGFNLNGNYGTCVSQTAAQVKGLTGFAQIYALKEIQDICSQPVKAWYDVHMKEQQARIAEANKPKWWHRLIPSGDAILSTGASVWIGTTQARYQYRTNREMFHAFGDLSNRPGGTYNINGDGSNSFALQSSGSFNGGNVGIDSPGSFGSGGTAFNSPGGFGTGPQVASGSDSNGLNTTTSTDSHSTDSHDTVPSQP